MCSVDADTADADGEKFMRRDSVASESDGAKCHKCGIEDPQIVLQKKYRYCPACFEAAIVHKFRRNFGTSKVCRPGEGALIAHAGDVACSALLLLVRSYETMKLNATVLHVDDGNIRGVVSDAITNRIKREAEAQGCQFHSVSIDEAASSEDAPNETASIAEAFNSVKNATSKKELLKKMRRILLLRYAKRLGCNCILFADSSADLATDSLVNVCLGGALHAASDVGFIDDRNEIKILRPMREITREELQHYSTLHNIPPAIPEKITIWNDPALSIQGRIERFIDDLQQNFPSTVSTVVRTCNKLEAPAKPGRTELCVLCQSLLDNQITECSSLQATTFSKQISSIANGIAKCSFENGTSNDCTDNSCCSSAITKNEASNNMNNVICYRCHLIINDMKDVNALPQYIHLNATINNHRMTMKNSIQEYLLDS